MNYLNTASVICAISVVMLIMLFLERSDDIEIPFSVANTTRTYSYTATIMALSVLLYTVYLAVGTYCA